MPSVYAMYWNSSLSNAPPSVGAAVRTYSAAAARKTSAGIDLFALAIRLFGESVFNVRGCGVL